MLTVALAADDALSALQAELVAGRSERDRLRARARGRSGRTSRSAGCARGTRIDARRALDPPAPELAFAAPALTLYRSHTAAGGARYEPLERVDLR